MFTNRLQRLLNSSYPGLCREVLVESACFVVGSMGEMIDQAYIGATKRGFLIAKEKQYSDIDKGLELTCVLPLQFCTFTVWDDRACRFAVCTDMGSSYFFEVSDVKDIWDMPSAWAAWRAYIERRGDMLRNFGFTPWQVYPCANESTDSRRKYSDVMFLKRPATMCLVTSVGMQVCEYFDYFLQNKKLSLTEKYDNNSQGDDPRKAKYLPKDRHYLTSQLQPPGGQSWRKGLSRAVSEMSLRQDVIKVRGATRLRSSKSENDVINCKSFSDMSSWKSRTFDLLLDSNRDNRFSSLFPTWRESEVKLDEATRIWRIQSNSSNFDNVRAAENSASISSLTTSDQKSLLNQAKPRNLKRILSRLFCCISNSKRSSSTVLDSKIDEYFNMLLEIDSSKQTEEKIEMENKPDSRIKFDDTSFRPQLSKTEETLPAEKYTLTEKATQTSRSSPTVTIKRKNKDKCRKPPSQKI